MLPADKFFLRVGFVLHSDHPATRQANALCTQRGLAPTNLPLHQPELDLHVFHQGGVTIVAHDVLPRHVQFVVRYDARVCQLDEAIPLPFPIRLHNASVAGFLVELEVFRDGWRGLFPARLPLLRLQQARQPLQRTPVGLPARSPLGLPLGVPFGPRLCLPSLLLCRVRLCLWLLQQGLPHRQSPVAHRHAFRNLANSSNSCAAASTGTLAS
mmetsp:Transcript_27829/g.76943  ORF Transcript_27829/g.76943 Transcript_27829/m.76943 type:complete len:212 (+) Transcript_27829:670-1305(+)